METLGALTLEGMRFHWTDGAPTRNCRSGNEVMKDGDVRWTCRSPPTALFGSSARADTRLLVRAVRLRCITGRWPGCRT